MQQVAQKDKITTGLGVFSKIKFNALLTLREVALQAVRSGLVKEGYTEVSTSSLVNIAGSCENPYASFRVNYYGKEAHLSQSAQLQLEALVLRLRRPVFTVNNSFREENYDDPEAQGRRLSEFTLIEAERPYAACTPESALEKIIATEKRIIQSVVNDVLHKARQDIVLLGGNVRYLASTVKQPFARLQYDEAVHLLRQQGIKIAPNADLGVLEERAILKHFSNQPTFLIAHPASIKFFNMKRMKGDKKVYSVDLLMPRLGETIGGAVREEHGTKLLKQLLGSRVAGYLQQRGADPKELFAEYLKLFQEEKPLLRGGFGIGFERLIGFLLASNDILETIAYRTIQPKR